MNHPQPLLAGVLPVVQTPFTDDDAIDPEVLQREIEWLFRQGARGVVVAMVSEVLRLSTDERRLLAQLVCQASRGQGGVVVSVGAESTHTAVALARHAAESGAAALMAIPPLATAAPQSELLAYFTALLEATPLPLIVQDASGYVGRPLPIELLARLLDEHGPERVWFKPEAVPIGPRLSALRQATSGRARVFEGSGGIALVDSYRRGIVGTMPGADLVAAVVALWGALQRGDDERAYAISLPLSSLVALQAGLDGFLAVEKHLLVRQGVFSNARVRGPVAYRLDAETAAEVDRLFDRLTAVVADGG